LEPGTRSLRAGAAHYTRTEGPPAAPVTLARISGP
jgi:hypothetical protein